ncbi:MAG: 50S ribosomal protein L40e [Candidatus Aenigmatarchaeota archaeon]|nr:MAG: 50S ribosomal protein L40e [Candidatus Aenigmarchaeota archaeon]
MSKDIAYARLFSSVYICMHCNAKIRAQGAKVKLGKIKCRKCGSNALRVKSKESRG